MNMRSLLGSLANDLFCFLLTRLCESRLACSHLFGGRGCQHSMNDRQAAVALTRVLIIAGIIGKVHLTHARVFIVGNSLVLRQASG